MSQKPLPPLSVGTPYLAAEFERFELVRHVLEPGQEATLRLHLTNATTIDLPTNEAELKRLLVVLCDAFPATARDHVKLRGW
jgi:hypothetical protein